VIYPPDMEGCDLCRLAYPEIYWLPDDVWARITPATHPQGGFLCIRCANERARKQGITLRWTAESL